MATPLPLLPFHVAARVYDDLHAIADAARALPGLIAGLELRIDEAETRLATLAGVGDRARDVLGRADVLDVRAQDVVERADLLDARAGQVIERIDAIDARIGDVLRVLERVERELPLFDRLVVAVDQLSASSQVLAAAALPLQGTAERIGNLADRIPAPRAPRRRKPKGAGTAVEKTP